MELPFCLRMLYSCCMRGSGQNSYAASRGSDARSQNGDRGFEAVIQFKLFPRTGQPENDEGFTIAKAVHQGTGEVVTIKGKFGPVSEGQLLVISDGAWRDDARYGESYQVWSVSHADPITQKAVLHYLQNLDGVGPVIAKAIVDHFGHDALSKIDRDPSALLDVRTASGHKINHTDLNNLMKQWNKLRADRKNMLYLSSIGVGDGYAKKISKFYGIQCVTKVKADPYAITEVDGISFRTADGIAERLGIDAKDPRRIEAGVEYVLEKAEGAGHICLSREEMFVKAPDVLMRGMKRPESQEIDSALSKMIDKGRLWSEVGEDGIERIYTTELFNIETRLYQMLEKLLTAEKIKLPYDMNKPEGSTLTDEQWHAIENAYTERLSIITGGPGTGKTSTLRGLLDSLDKNHQSYLCLAPTGKAAKRMNESTGRKASTVHRALGWVGRESPKTMQIEHNSNAFEEDLIIIDESSMLDMRMCERVLSHMTDRSRLVLVGDPDQLPAVGAGSVLLDLIDSKRVHMTRLSKVFRQAEHSLLVVNSHRIKNGKSPYWTTEEAEAALGHAVKEDWKFVPIKSGEEAMRHVLEYAEKLPRQLIIADEDILVTAPSRKGTAGVYALNQALQELKNPHGRKLRKGDEPIRVGDRVMNIKNRYAKQNSDDADIMNGDVGIIDSFDEKTKTAWVRYDFADDLVPYNGAEQVKDLIPCYAATTHKLQGSEAPVVIAPIIAGSSMHMLNRNLLYTAWTRAKEQCIVLGSKEVLEEAIKKDGSRRNTTLDLRVGKIEDRVLARWQKQVKFTSANPASLLFGNRPRITGPQADEPVPSKWNKPDETEY